MSVKSIAYKKESIATKIFQTIRDRIISGYYPPGSLMSEKEVTEEFKVSRTPYREALHLLEAMKLVKIIPRYGTIVSEININEIIEAYEVRLRLEAMAAEFSAQRRTQDHLKRFKSILDQFTLAGDERDIIHEADLDTLLHELICEASQNSILAESVFNLRLICGRIWTTSWWNDYNREIMVEHWRKIYEAWQKKDSQSALQVMTSHIQVSIDIVRNNIFST